MKSTMKKLLAMILVIACFVSGCGSVGYEEDKTYTYDEATQELASKLTKVECSEIKAPLDIYDNDTPTKTLASIDTFPLTVEGNGAVNIEIAAATELTGKAPDDLITVLAKKFNNQQITINGKTASVTVRKITSGEVLTYMTEGGYKPDVYIPSSYAWGEMLEASGINTIKLTDRIAGNTAGILMEKTTHDRFIEKYQTVTVDKVLEASLAGDLTFAYSNPYTSSTGLNILASMLYSFDPSNPLSDQASAKLLEYQRQTPPVAYTTDVLSNQAAKGIIKAMVMEEQAWRKAPELKDYVYVPAGIRHDHPVYTFDHTSSEKQEVAKEFVEYCLSDEAQAIASEKGFNLHNDYKEQSAGLDGAGYLAAQRIWKTNKDGGKPIIAIFVADISDSMNGAPLNALKESLTEASSYISSDHYIGLVSYANEVYINLSPIEYDESGKPCNMTRFDETQRAYFSGAVKALTPNGATATYDAVLVALDILRQGAALIPDAKLMLFVLSDGAQNRGYSLDRIKNIVAGMRVPVYTIGYNLSNTADLEALSTINEAALINADTENVINELRNLFNIQL